MFLKRACLLVMCANVLFAQSSEKQPVAEIITEHTFVNQEGYNFEFKTSDGISRKEEAQLITVGEQQGIGVKGSYSYTAPDGLTYEVTFTADDKGYKPSLKIIGGNQ